MTLLTDASSSCSTSHSFSVLCCSFPEYLSIFPSHAAALQCEVPAVRAPQSHIHLCNNTEMVGKLCDTCSLWREARSILHPPSLLGTDFFFSNEFYSLKVLHRIEEKSSLLGSIAIVFLGCCLNLFKLNNYVLTKKKPFSVKLGQW